MGGASYACLKENLGWGSIMLAELGGFIGPSQPLPEAEAFQHKVLLFLKKNSEIGRGSRLCHFDWEWGLLLDSDRPFWHVLLHCSTEEASFA